MPDYVQHVMMNSETALIRTKDAYIVRDITEDVGETEYGEYIEFAFQEKVPQFSSLRYAGRIFCSLATQGDLCALAGSTLLLLDRRRHSLLSELELPEAAVAICFVRTCIAVGLVSGKVLLLQAHDFKQQVQFSLPCSPRQLFSYTGTLIALLVSGEIAFIDGFEIKRVLKTDKPLKQISVAPYLQESELRILALAWDGQVYYIDDRGSRMVPTARRLISIDTYVVGILTGMDSSGSIFLIDVDNE